MAPIGFGALEAHWQPRVRLAGTYDEEWQRTRWPLPPVDFDPAFFNVAPADQQADEYRPGERVDLTYMTVNAHEHVLLPPLDVPVTVTTRDDLVEEIAIVDTIVIEPEERRLTLIARAAAPLHDGPVSLRQVVVGDRPPRRRSRRAAAEVLR